MGTKTVQLTAKEFEARVARFPDLTPNVDEYVEKTGVLKEAYEFVAAKYIYYLMGQPNDKVDTATKPALATSSDASVYIVGTPPGDSPTLHAHMHTWESFVVLKGRYKFSAGDHGQYTAELGEFDTFSCPPGVTRAFKNITDEDAYLLVIITGDEEALDDIAIADDIGEEIVDRWGASAKEGLEKVGMRFDVDKQDIQERLDL